MVNPKETQIFCPRARGGGGMGSHGKRMPPIEAGYCGREQQQDATGPTLHQY